MDENRISEKLIRLAQNDMAARERSTQDDQLSSGYHPEMERCIKVHKENTDALREIMKE